MIVVFGLFVAGTMTVVQLWFWRNRRVHREEVDRLLAFAARGPAQAAGIAGALQARHGLAREHEVSQAFALSSSVRSR